jgi:hypothetical protein
MVCWGGVGYGVERCGKEDDIYGLEWFRLER